MQILKNSTPHHFVRKWLVVFFGKWGGLVCEQGGEGGGVLCHTLLQQENLCLAFDLSRYVLESCQVSLNE